jgi:hypothetical protein
VFGYTTGLGNVGIGFCAGNMTQTGCDNFAAGCNALVNNTSGCNNFAQGTSSLSANTIGRNNLAVGYNALKTNTSGNNNVAIGCFALYSSPDGNDNIAIGAWALSINSAITGGNIAIGACALCTNTFGWGNVAVGCNALRFNSGGNCNTAQGQSALFRNTTGCANTAVGTSSLAGNTIGNCNVAIGPGALYASNATGGNVAIGVNAGCLLTTGVNNTIIGSLPGTAGMSSTVLIGAGATERIKVDATGMSINSNFMLGTGGSLGGTAGNQVTLATLRSNNFNGNQLEITDTRTTAGTSWNTAATRIQEKIDDTWMGFVEFNGTSNNGGVTVGAGTSTAGPTSVSNIMYVKSSGVDITGAITATGDITAFFSDRRLKTNVCVITDAVTKVRALTGIRYTPNQLAEQLGFATDESIVGLFADELEAVLPEAVKLAPFDSDENGDSKSGENYKTIQYEKVVPLLVEAIKELSREFDEFKKKFS